MVARGGHRPMCKIMLQGFTGTRGKCSSIYVYVVNHGSAGVDKGVGVGVAAGMGTGARWLCKPSPKSRVVRKMSGNP